MKFQSLTILALAFALASCSVILDKSAVQCSQDADCAQFDALSSCQNSLCGQPPILLGQSAPATGSNQALGLEMNRGLQLAFDVANQTGGIAGRQIRLQFLDDQYDPTVAEGNARTLTAAEVSTDEPKCPTTATPPAGGAAFSQTALKAGKGAVLAMIGSVGTPTMVRAAPITVETGRLFFGAFTGATTMLRNTQAGPCAKFIFNMRASYAQEARATLEYFFVVKVLDDKHLISFDQNDSFGDAGYNGLVAAYQALKNVAPTISRFRYTRNDVNSVPTQVVATTAYLTQLLSADALPHVVGIMMTDTYGPGAAYIKGVKDWLYAADAQQGTLSKASRLTLYFSNVSFVGPDALAAQLKNLGALPTPSGRMENYSDRVFVSQVVPNYATDANEVVVEYRRLIAATGVAPSFTSLEGFLAGRLFVEGLKANKGPITPDSMVTAFESLPPLNLALGAAAGFSPTNHQYSQSVWGTGFNPDGSFSNTYFYSNNTLQLFQ